MSTQILSAFPQGSSTVIPFPTQQEPKEPVSQTQLYGSAQGVAYCARVLASTKPDVTVSLEIL